MDRYGVPLTSDIFSDDAEGGFANVSVVVIILIAAEIVVAAVNIIVDLWAGVD